MAIHDQRTVWWNDQWWVATVIGGTGVSAAGPPRITHETVLVTSLSDETENSRASTIPAGWLNQLRYRALVKLIQTGEDYGQRLEMSPHNAPDEREFSGWKDHVDWRGLKWKYRKSYRRMHVPAGEERTPILEFVCMSDSALSGEMGFFGEDTLQDFLTQHGETGISEILKSLEGDFRDYPAEDFT